MAVGGLKGMERRVAAVPATEIDTSVADLPRRPSHPHTSPPNAQKSATGTWKSKLQVQLPEPKRQWTLLGISVGSMASKPTVGAPGKTKRAASGDGTGDTLSPQMGADEKAVRQSPNGGRRAGERRWQRQSRIWFEPADVWCVERAGGEGCSCCDVKDQ
ncbi:hypothetical protein BD410DRAFT_646256 [Rickenella mellea]|uniref:Uncharacterized protein n=1 Tax=Rickenella mellea TaxID=50990 RepID=A0A4Y7PNV7_9AGAM|nr:hypothetical protein BD410DRAFT_646256 [Rickenella mellea]